MDQLLVGMHIAIYQDKDGHKYVKYMLDGETAVKTFIPDGMIQRHALDGIVDKLK